MAASVTKALRELGVNRRGLSGPISLLTEILDEDERVLEAVQGEIENRSIDVTNSLLVLTNFRILIIEHGQSDSERISSIYVDDVADMCFEKHKMKSSSSRKFVIRTKYGTEYEVRNIQNGEKSDTAFAITFFRLESKLFGQRSGMKINREISEISSYQTRVPDAEIKEMLVSDHGLTCAGCDRQFDDAQYLELDHLRPKSKGGDDDVSNRILLCGPCNRRKSNTLTLDELRAKNETDGKMSGGADKWDK